jgi:hypothetical protein
VVARAFSIAVLTVAGSCGSGEPPTQSRGPSNLTSARMAADDVIVASVDGRPIFGSCVAAQAAGRHESRAAALADCIDFELLAGAAQARGLDRDDAVVAAARDASATRFLDVEWRERYRQFTDLPSDFRQPIFDDNRVRMVRPESRASFYGRIMVDPADVGSARDHLAETAMRAAYEQLATRSDLFRGDLDRTVHAAAAATDPTLAVEIGIGNPTEADFGLREYFRHALFSISAIGQVSTPVRSPWGWDMILYSDVRRPPPLTEAQLGDKLFPAARLTYFTIWIRALSAKHQIAIADDPTLARHWGDPFTEGRRP